MRGTDGHPRPQPTRRTGDVAASFVWLALAAVLVRTGSGPIDVLLAFGLLVVVPFGLPLVTGHPTPPVVRLAAFVAAASLSLAAGAAVVASLPWLAASGALLVDRLVVLGASRHDPRPARIDHLLGAIAIGWIVVSALLLVGSRAGLTLGPVPRPLDELGAVHFIFAGFGATTMVRALRRTLHGRTVGRAANLTAVLLIGGAATVGVGHLTIRPIELVGTASIASGAVLLASLSWSVAPEGSRRRLLLRVSGLAVLAPMALALLYSWHLTTGTPFWSYDALALTHGALNAFGFVTAGLAGWRTSVAPVPNRSPAAGATIHRTSQPQTSSLIRSS